MTDTEKFLDFVDRLVKLTDDYETARGALLDEATKAGVDPRMLQGAAAYIEENTCEE